MDGEEVLGEITNTDDNNMPFDNTNKPAVKTVSDHDNSDNSDNSENVSPGHRRGVKRRSITEAGPQTPSAVVTTVRNTAIIFETDL